jgi:hypothetical protein
LSPYILIGIPLVYFFGIAALRLAGVFPESLFSGKYFMLAYMMVCVITFVHFLAKKRGK